MHQQLQSKFLQEGRFDKKEAEVWLLKANEQLLESHSAVLQLMPMFIQSLGSLAPTSMQTVIRGAVVEQSWGPTQDYLLQRAQAFAKSHTSPLVSFLFEPQVAHRR